MNGARYAYLQEICDLVEQGEDIVIVSEDYAAPIFDEFREKHPERFLSVGIAEQNGMAVACGLALAGKYPIVYGCAPFPLTRAIDQMKSAVSGMHLPMTILNSGIGFGVPEFGATHYNIDDVSMARPIPGIKIITPSDNVTARQLASFSLAYHSPIYLRMDKYSEKELYRASEIDFECGYGIVWESEKAANLVIVSCGFMLHGLLEISKKLESEGICIKLIDLYSLPFDSEKFVSAIGDLPILSIEEHVMQGGIGSAILEILNDRHLHNSMKRMGVDFKGSYPNTSGSRNYYIETFGLSDKDIIEAARQICSTT